MSFKEIINIADVLGLYFYHWPWMLSAMFLLLHNQRGVGLKAGFLKAIRFIYHEGKPLYFVYVGVDVLDLAMAGSSLKWLGVFNVAMNIWLWHMYKDVDKDDDRWRRRKQKLKEMVTVTEGKLAVVPAQS